ncbi:hypothetical protein [Pseudooceanicola sp.]|uniref:hypothetical protein n=1 Tax=Pseudooceanicola sp. TaxID=1914328 RepID=UPI002609D58F|nr:hypothetical protein [Pseudooceanicola sp.]MDF1856924.1 hypothetical protein [Pseudooceanicola sp.]
MITLPLAWVVSILTIIAALALTLTTRLPAVARLFLGLFLLSLAITSGLLGLRLGYAALLRVARIACLALLGCWRSPT